MKLEKYRLFALCGGILLSSAINAVEPGTNHSKSLCPQSLNIPERPIIDAVLGTDEIFFTADEADLIEDSISTLTGNVEVSRNAQQIRADVIEYNQTDDTADLEGDVNYWDEALYLQSRDAFLQFDNGIGEFNAANFVLIDKRGRGVADKMILDVGTRTDLEGLEYSTCEPNNKFWSFTASSMTLDHETDYGKAKNVILKIKNVPVFYTPYLSFPLSGKRKSGFLAPAYGNTTRHGYELRTPYYWNISPDMDATLTPRVLTDNGIMAIAEYRYLSRSGSGVINAEYLASDNKRDDRHRNLFGVELNQRFFDGGNIYINYKRVSDRFYFEDFGNQLSTTSTRFLEQRVDITYNGNLYGNYWGMLLRLQNFQTVDRSIDITSRPYKRLPQLVFNYRTPRRSGEINYGFKAESVYFDRGNDPAFTDNVNGFRFNLKPYISYPMRTTAAFLEPKLTLDYTQYSLEGSANFENNPNRLLPVFSLDSGVFLERDVRLFNTNFLQTLEPRLFYLYIPKKEQSGLPVFDTGLYTFSFDSLFRENRFNSADRLGDANQLVLSVTSYLINKNNGQDLGSISLGQFFYFRDREVTLPGATILDEDFSAIVARFNTRIIENWNIRGDFQFDPNLTTDGIEKFTAQASYNPSPGTVLNMAYRVRHDTTDIEQADISLHWSFNRKWSIVGRWNYAIPENRSLEMFAGIEYEHCCWSARAVARRFLTDVDGKFENGFFLQMELKGLANIGKKTVHFLKQQIPGYQSEF